MKNTFVSTISLIAVIFISCSKDDNQITSSPTGSDISMLVGDYDIEAWEYSLASDTSQKTDWVITRGLSGTFIISINGDYSTTVIVGIDTFNVAGTLALSADTIYFDGNDNDPPRFELNIPILTLFSTEAELVDIDLDGNPEDVWQKIVYRRR